MSSGPDGSQTHRCGHDAAAYALGALEPAEADAFARHLYGCAVCRDEVLSFQQVVDALPMGAPQHPVPRELRMRVLNGVRSEPRQDPELVRHSRTWRTRTRPAAARAWLPRPALGFAVLLVAILAGVGAVGLVPGHQSGTRVIQARVTGVPGSAELKLTGSHAELAVRHLPPPPAGRIYEVWLRRGAEAPSPTSALFDVTANGSGDVDVPGDLHGVTAVMVTQEPAGGSLVPSHPAVILARLT